MRITAIQRPTSLVEGVCDKLTTLIQSDSTTEERWLPAERTLAEQLGVSRSVVREATKRLEQHGLLEIQHGSGIKIVDKLHRPLNDTLSRLIPDVADRLRQLNETRLAIEPQAARQAAVRAKKAEFRVLRKLHAQLEAAIDFEESIALDIAFHRAIAEASGNLIFRLVLESLADLGIASRRRTIGRMGKQVAIDHHRKILEAIESHDEVAAHNAMRDHILAAGQDMDLESLKPQKKK